MGNDEIKALVQSNHWLQLTEQYSPIELATRISFRDGLRVASWLLAYQIGTTDFQTYSTDLLEALRISYSQEWNKAWQYDAFLGYFYFWTCEHEKRYEAYKRAFDKAENPPPRLLIDMADCAICPGDSPIDRRIAIDLVKRALQEGPFIDGIGVLRGLYCYIGDKEQEAYWANIFKKANHEIKSYPLDFLGDDFFKQQGMDGLSTVEKSSVFYKEEIKNG